MFFQEKFITAEENKDDGGRQEEAEMYAMEGVQEEERQENEKKDEDDIETSNWERKQVEEQHEVEVEMETVMVNYCLSNT